MTYTFNVNQTPATCAVAVYNLKEQLKTAGWTVPRSSDGSTYNDSGDQITSGGSDAYGMDNASAWFVIEEPASPFRQFCFQRTSSTGANTSYQWRIKYSDGYEFDGGSPSATQVPSATDEQVLLGSGTDGSPGFGNFFGTNTDGGFRHNIVADNADAYGWASFAWVNTTGRPTHCMVFDPVTGVTTADDDPVVIYLNGTLSSQSDGGNTGSGPGQWQSLMSSSNAHLFAYQAGEWKNSIRSCGLTVFEGSTTRMMIPYGLNVDEDGDDNTMVVPYVDFNNSTGRGDWKGFSSMILFAGTARATGTTLSISSTKDNVVLCDIALPWDGSSTPTI